MKSANNPSENAASSSLPELFARYLQRQAEAHASGLAAAETGEVVPFEAAPVQPVDARLAWNEAVAAASFFVPKAETGRCQPPADWPALVATHEPETALAFCLGNFPQLVRSLHPLLHGPELSALPPNAGRPAVGNLEEWASEAAQTKQYPQTLLALGSLRLAKQFDSAVRLLDACQAEAPTPWQPALANERAALAWHQGRAEEAAALWQTQQDAVPVLFNRGMAALFLGKRGEARSWLNQAVAQLPEVSGWHHLGRLYLALAQMPTR